MLKRRTEVAASKPRVPATASRTVPSAERSRWYSASATGVGTTPRPRRTKSSSRNTWRSRVSAWLMAGCVIAKRCAARDRPRSS